MLQGDRVATVRRVFAVRLDARLVRQHDGFEAWELGAELKVPLTFDTLRCW